MSGFIEGVDRDQVTLFPDSVEDWTDADNLVRVADLFEDELDLADLGFARASHARPRYHPSVLLTLFIYGYLNRVPSSRALEREAGRNVEVMWLMGRLIPGHKTIADFRRDNGAAIRRTCAGFVQICRQIGVLKGDCVAIDGSRFKAVNNRDKNFTKCKIASRIAHLEAGIDRYLEERVRIDRQDKGEAREEKIANLAQRYGRIRQENQRLQEVDQASNDAPDGQISLTDVDARAMATIEQPALSRISRPRGAQSISTGGANLFFLLANARYEKTAMSLTSNGGFAEWREVFGDLVVATALLDSLLHHAALIQIEWASYRLRGHADLIPEHLRANAPIPPPPPAKRRGRPPKPKNAAADH